MSFVENFNFYGVEARQIPCIKGSGRPTELTPGAVGVLYMDTSTGILYKCIDVNEKTGVWLRIEVEEQPFIGGELVINDDGTLSVQITYSNSTLEEFFSYVKRNIRATAHFFLQNENVLFRLPLAQIDHDSENIVQCTFTAGGISVNVTKKGATVWIEEE